ncbi:hypothetical protein B7Y92_04175 [Candidatus Saccharibacteria bacterium 32-50-13]|nr:MAG: hypothetical protein B7Y92_04175 [Candidatus Saccharibacteria bacterium 32-50-13]
MPLTPWLIDKVRRTVTDIQLVAGDSFYWSPTERQVVYNATDEQADSLLLHELGHATLGHLDYGRDVSLLAMESDAWEEARRHGQKLGIEIDDETIENHLNSYRDWLHARSTCPNCSATGLQIGTKQYRCPACQHEWRVNEARTCQLRRYSKN